MLGALILGDFAVQAGWLGPEVLVYMAFVSVAGFAQPSYELGYAFKLLRVALLLLTAAFDVWGFCLGFVGILVLLATTKPLVGHGYLYPLIPFNGKALRRLLVREPSIGTTPERPAPPRTRGQDSVRRVFTRKQKIFQTVAFPTSFGKMGALMKRTAGTKAHPGAFDEERRDSYHGSS